MIYQLTSKSNDRKGTDGRCFRCILIIIDTYGCIVSAGGGVWIFAGGSAPGIADDWTDAEVNGSVFVISKCLQV